MYNLRYHIASLVAVFLALSVGLVLGSIVVERGTIDRQQAALVKSLQTDFVRINRENKEMTARLDATEEFAGALLPRATSNLLSGKTILVLTNSGRTDGLSSAVDGIERAGGKAAVGILERPGLGLEDEKVASAIRGATGTSAEGDALAESVAASLTAEWADAGPRPLTDALVKAGALRIDNLPQDTSADGMVMLASWDGEADPITLDLARAQRDRNLTAVGAQALISSTDVADAFAADGFDAVNDLGTPRGEYSLAVLLAGLAQGYYGAGPAVDAPFPPVPVPGGLGSRPREVGSGAGCAPTARLPQDPCSCGRYGSHGGASGYTLARQSKGGRRGGHSHGACAQSATGRPGRGFHPGGTGLRHRHHGHRVSGRAGRPCRRHHQQPVVVASVRRRSP